MLITPHRRRVVLLVTHTGDFFTIDAVARGLRRRGVEPVRFDTDAFPTLVRLSLLLDGGGERALVHLPDGTSIAGADVVGVWLRRVFPARLPDGLDPELVPGCQTETGATLTALWGALAPARFIDPPQSVAAAEDKLSQLRLARACGLRVPRTLVTNDPREVRRFHDEAGGRLVTKLQRALSQSMGRAPLSVPTSALGPDDLRDLDGLACAPMVFQERIEKQAELRVACVGERLFVGAIDARASRAGRVDWRRATADECRWTRDELPGDVQDGLRRLMRALGLRFGAADIVRTPEGEHVFLELNPAGEWGMLERDLGLPIGDALAEELLSA